MTMEPPSPHRPLPYSRLLIKVSGEALLGSHAYGIDPSAVDAIAADVGEVMRTGKLVAVVMGGGNIFRGMSGAAKGMDRAKADYMGMLATVMNSLALEQALGRFGQPSRVFSGLPVPSICEPFQYDRARASFEAGFAVIFAGGTGSPYFTTDTAAALRAAELGCDALLKATQVDGVYSGDPKTDSHVERYECLTFSEVLARDLKVMDAAAIALARDNDIPIVVFSLHEKGAIGKVLRGEATCSLVARDPPL